MPTKNMPLGLLEFLYDLAVHRMKKKDFYLDPGKYIDRFNREVPPEKQVSKEDKAMLEKDAHAINDVYEARKKAHSQAHNKYIESLKEFLNPMPFETEIEKTYGKEMPQQDPPTVGEGDMDEDDDE